MLDQVTVVKTEDKVQMTTLREQIAAFTLEAEVCLASSNLRADTAAYLDQVQCTRAKLFSSLEQAELSTPLVHYPFGGVDVVTALSLCQSAGSVLFAGAEVFGGLQDLAGDLCKLRSSPYTMKGAGATMFDSHDDFERLHEELGTRGVGALALARLVGPLALTVDLVAYVDVLEDGTITFRPPHLLAATTCMHALVGVRRTPESPPCWMWWVQQNTRHEDTAVDALCERVRPDVLLVKAAPDTLWNKNASTPDAHAAYLRCVRRALAPASRANCAVLTDSCQSDPAVPPAIFRRREDVRSLPFAQCARQSATRVSSSDEEDVFGYGHCVFASCGSNLLSTGGDLPASGGDIPTSDGHLASSDYELT